MTRVLVLDAGTSGLKAVLFGADGGVIASREAGYGLAPAAHRQSVEGWWQAAQQAVAALDVDAVEAIALTGTMENLIAVDATGAPVHDAILYSDPCGGAALDAARPSLDALGATAILGNAPEPLMTAFKLRWLIDNAPDVVTAARWLMPGAKDALALRLTGRAATDPVTATTTGLMDLATRDWSPALIEALGLPAGKLPPILPAGAVLGPLTGEAASALGLTPGLPVINGCGDGGATTLGSLCRVAGDVSLYLGTSGWVARVIPADGLSPNPMVYRLAHPAPGLIIEITPILSAGAAGNWAREVLAISPDERDALLAEADSRPGELLFLPYLAGERFPFLDTEVRGAFLGLDASHGRADLYHAVLEGVALAIRANLDSLDPGGTARIRLAGGGATSTVWPQMIADVLGRTVSLPDDPANATALGAFMIAAEALGLGPVSFDEDRRIEPRVERQARAARLRTAFARGTMLVRSHARE